MAGALGPWDGFLASLRRDARYIYDGSSGEALPLVILWLVCGIAVLVLLRRGAHRGARVLAEGPLPR